jgi:hypothetical protein
MLAPDRRPHREGQRHRAEKRKAVPVTDRVAQAGDPRPVGKERRHDLPGERPDDHGRQQHRHHGGRPPDCARHRHADEEPEDEEGEVDERAVQVLPGLVRHDRPQHRQSRPADERRQQQHRRQAEAVEPRPGEQAEPGERDRNPGREHRGAADEDERPVRRSVRPEQRDRKQYSRDAEEDGARALPGTAWEARVHRRRSYHR